MDVLPARLLDLARGALKRSDARFSRFLDPVERGQAERAARDVGVCVCYWGGYLGAERAVTAFYMDDAPEGDDFPIICLKASWDARYGTVTHRDLLGAEMALGLTRECLGDIAMGEGCAFLFALEDAARYVEQNLESAGRAHLTFARVDGPDALAEPDGRARHVTVASMRLDAVLAGAYDMSRADAQRLIARELVKLNHVVEARPAVQLRAGDLISARGMGRARVLDEPKETRKGRLALEIFVYGG